VGRAHCAPICVCFTPPGGTAPAGVPSAKRPAPCRAVAARRNPQCRPSLTLHAPAAGWAAPTGPVCVCLNRATAPAGAPPPERPPPSGGRTSEPTTPPAAPDAHAPRPGRRVGRAHRARLRAPHPAAWDRARGRAAAGTPRPVPSGGRTPELLRSDGSRG